MTLWRDPAVSVTPLPINEAAEAHLNRAMDNGLTQTEASEAITQLAFYVGWPNVFFGDAHRERCLRKAPPLTPAQRVQIE